MKKGKKALALFGALSLVLVLSACSTDPVTSESTGIWDHYIIWNFVRAIKALSNLFGGSYGWGIVIFTIIVRIIILPLMFYQMKSSRKSMEIQPQLKALQEKYPDRDQDSMRAMQEEQKKLYAEAGVNPVAGCLPLLVQMPVLVALYQAIFRSQELKTGSFLWMQLGDKDPYFILPVLAALFTFATSKLSTMSQPDTGQKGMMAAMTYGMPLMIFITALSVPSALSLYWVITNAFSVGQTLLINNPFKINRERAEKEQAKKDRERNLQKAKKKALKNRKK
ncbi:membrane protein insertase YidC [Ligilactobacillus pobuzihii]|uniref:Membrane protein insertase YidC n=1 Tax=Ligilactobacillus pobuzihii TaxID=449659 RepID=A0A0R2L9V3_9LACO|nr:membrane protein insertase YidC [Ligilactobacillus pobuzihii]KRK10391.1 Stage III sporulation protein J [Ligilactobacillus pobuzihii E100301 = KCTC 13174]KRN98594.1 Stage III sporulation protein J [Ligilactobacillus pobuzihii]GEN47606.1 membrane protein insertase YidC [Ligilactobacillus pobuzihii]